MSISSVNSLFLKQNTHRRLLLGYPWWSMRECSSLEKSRWTFECIMRGPTLSKLKTTLKFPFLPVIRVLSWQLQITLYSKHILHAAYIYRFPERLLGARHCFWCLKHIEQGKANKWKRSNVITALRQGKQNCDWESLEGVGLNGQVVILSRLARAVFIAKLTSGWRFGDEGISWVDMGVDEDFQAVPRASRGAGPAGSSSSKDLGRMEGARRKWEERRACSGKAWPAWLVFIVKWEGFEKWQSLISGWSQCGVSEWGWSCNQLRWGKRWVGQGCAGRSAVWFWTHHVRNVF